MWPVVLAVGLILAIVLTSPSLSLVGGMPEQGRAAYSTINAVWLVLLVILTAIVTGALRRGETILSEMHVAVDAASVETLAQEEQRRRVVQEVAATLHGTLQGRLASLPDHGTAGDAVRETLALLQSREPMSTSATLEQVAQGALDPWRSLIDIRLDASHDVITPEVAQAVSDVLEECVANAFRHGRASEVACTVETRGDHVHVRVSDNGSGSRRPAGPAGLGSRILDRSGTWARTTLDSGTTVDISIPRTPSLGR
jgi:two-component sensor histidine kinase